MTTLTPSEPTTRSGREPVPAEQPPAAAYALDGGRVLAAAATSCGSMHPANEDAHSRLTGVLPLFVVADGVGGGALAATASRELVRQLHASLGQARASPEVARRVLLEADREVARRIAEHTDFPGAATVALCLPVDGQAGRWLLSWVGDCRIYRVGTEPATAAELLSRDDSYRELHETPPRGAAPEDPARMVGNGAVNRPNVRVVELAPGELLMLCSDGVHKHASRADIAAVLQDPVPLRQRCDRLLALAREGGSLDDATVLLLQREVRARRWFQRPAPLLAALALAAAAAAAGVLAWRQVGAAPAEAAAASSAPVSTSSWRLLNAPALQCAMHRQPTFIPAQAAR